MDVQEGIDSYSSQNVPQKKAATDWPTWHSQYQTYVSVGTSCKFLDLEQTSLIKLWNFK